MAIHITKFRRGLKRGYNSLTQITDKDNLKISLGAAILGTGEKYEETLRGEEVCYLLLKGEMGIEVNGQFFSGERRDVFNEKPVCWSISSGYHYKAKIHKSTEVIEIRAKNPKKFEPLFWPQNKIKIERRGKGLMQDAAFRLIKTVFDHTNHPKSNLVVGEVITLPGRWSSYPPHHHLQPEIYFYKFLPKEGYGFCQLGDKVLKVENNDAIKILNQVDHPQVTAPGYAMWYLWAIRHLPGRPYRGFDYIKEHTWMMLDKKAKIWT